MTKQHVEDSQTTELPQEHPYGLERGGRGVERERGEAGVTDTEQYKITDI